MDQTAAMWLIGLLLSAPLQAQPQAAALSVSTSARSMRPGELVVLTITAPPETTAVRARAFDRDAAAYRVDEGTWRAMIGIDLAVTPGSYAVAIEALGGAAPLTLTHRLLVTQRVFPTRRLRVAENFVNPPASEQARITREAQELESLWTVSSGQRLPAEPFVRPVPGAANSAFGTRSFFNGQLRSRHSGGDFVGSTGTPVQAPGAGRVVLAADLYFSGSTVVIDHGAGLFSLLAHLSAMDVKTGDPVGTGQVIGKVGATGRVTGPHLHWAVRANGGRVDPLSLLALLGARP